MPRTFFFRQKNITNVRNVVSSSVNIGVLLLQKPQRKKFIAMTTSQNLFALCATVNVHIFWKTQRPK